MVRCLNSSTCLPLGRTWSKLDEGALDVGARQLVGLQALHFLAAAGDLAGPRAGGEAGDELVELGDLLFALRVLRLERGAHLGLGHHHVVVAAGVDDDGLVIDVGGVGGDAVEKVAIVRDGDQRAVVVVEKVLQPVDRFEIEVVGGLVEHQGFRLAEQRLRQQHADLLAALQFAHLALVQFFRDVQAVEQDGGVGSRRCSRLRRR